MYRRKKRFRLPPVVLVFCVILGISIGGILAKYVFHREMNSQITFTIDLAEEVKLQEHAADRLANGSYELNANLLPEADVKGNTYKLLPGLDIRKDPFVQVVNKTPIGAYLYIEVKDSTNSAIFYQIDSGNWTKLMEITDKEIYVYKNGLILTNETCPTEEIPILQVPKGATAEIKVSQDLLAIAKAEKKTDILAFSAYLYEAQPGKTPAEIFTANQTD